MTETQRQWSLTGAALVVLLVLTAIDHAAITIGAALALIVIGLILLPQQRSRGALAAIVAACVAAALVAVSRSLR